MAAKMPIVLPESRVVSSARKIEDSSRTVIEIITAAELAKRLQVPESWIRSRVRSRTPIAEQLPHIALGRYIRFDWGAVMDWLRTRSQ